MLANNGWNDEKRDTQHESENIMNQSSPVVSLIIPFHNREEMLNQLIDTVPDIPEIEVIVVEDHSTEEVKIRRKFSKARMKRLSAPEGQRFAGAARNQGMRVAKGKYLCFADSDDLLVTSEFEDVIQTISLRENIDVFYGLVDSFLHDTGAPGSRHMNMLWLASQVIRTDNSDFLFRMHGPIAKFIRRDFVENQQLSFSSTLVSNDVLFNFHMCAAARNFEIIEKVVYMIREGNESLTTSTRGSTERIWTRFEIQETYNQGLCQVGRRYMRCPGIGYIRQMWVLDRREAFKMMAHCAKGATPLFALWTTLRFRIARKLWSRSRRDAT